MKFQLTLLALISVSASAFAETVDLKFTGMELSSPKIVNIQVGSGASKNVYAGRLKFSMGSKTLLSYCVDATSPLDSATHGYTSSTLNTQASNGLAYAGRIAAGGFSSAHTADQQAGLQLAIWSALYDGGTSFTANGANFKVSGASNEVLAWANSYYQGKSEAVSSLTQVRLFSAQSAGTQSQVTVEAVPEPATMLGVAAGLSALAARRRRKVV